MPTLPDYGLTEASLDNTVHPDSMDDDIAIITHVHGAAEGWKFSIGEAKSKTLFADVASAQKAADKTARRVFSAAVATLGDRDTEEEQAMNLRDWNAYRDCVKVWAFNYRERLQSIAKEVSHIEIAKHRGTGGSIAPVAWGQPTAHEGNRSRLNSE